MSPGPGSPLAGHSIRLTGSPLAWRLQAGEPGFDSEFRALLERRSVDTRAAEEVAREVFEAVRRDGDAALVAFARRFDGFDPQVVGGVVLRVDEIDAGVNRAGKEERAALALAAQRIRTYHERQMPRDLEWEDEPGIRLGWSWHPVACAGVYAPGGRACYPSSVLMSVIPARIAGVGHVTLTTPCAPDGTVDPLVLAAAREAGCDLVCRVGGAQAIAALACGTESVPRSDVIVGPGNIFVTAAKRIAFGETGIDTVAGPSELVVIADSSGNPEWIAWDLLAQAEHDPLAQSILVSDDSGLAEAVTKAVESGLACLSGRTAAESWARCGAVILVNAIEDAVSLVDAIAPEHLHVVTREPERIAREVRNAGAVFLGASTPEVFGDYMAGPSHVLPTAGTARFASGLSVLSFMKRTSVMRASGAAIRRLAVPIETLARAEGLEAHAKSARLRANGGREDS